MVSVILQESKTLTFYLIHQSVKHLEPTYQALLDSSFQLPVTSPFSNGQSLLPASLHCTLYPPGSLSPAPPPPPPPSNLHLQALPWPATVSPALSLHPVVPVI
ncbi:pectinesterase inhibitor 10-like [Oreochromis niloticus]|uniref:pectinesterase inhibitor 10-like n=1 Tax=Oreochromis niloticus TaxID=8128 RepID=UPI000DF4C989|nr:pectinesterase inhibitor 10-like [Oreochromis niloticus]